MPLLQDIQRDENTHRTSSSRLYNVSLVAKFLLTVASVVAGVSALADLLGTTIVGGWALLPAVITGSYAIK